MLWGLSLWVTKMHSQPASQGYESLSTERGTQATGHSKRIPLSMAGDWPEGWRQQLSYCSRSQRPIIQTTQILLYHEACYFLFGTRIVMGSGIPLKQPSTSWMR